VGCKRIEREFGVFLGITLDGDIFFSQGNDYGDILVSNISDYPLIDVEAD